MKEGKPEINFNLNAQNEKTSLDKLAESMKKSFFGVLTLCLKTQSFSMWAEVVFTIIQMFQLMAYTFRPLVNKSNLILVFEYLESRKLLYYSFKLLGVLSNSLIF
jgi:hypothetical protein